MSVLSNVRNIPLPGKFVDAGEHAVTPALYAQLAGRVGIEGETLNLQTEVTFQVVYPFFKSKVLMYLAFLSFSYIECTSGI